MNKTESTTLPKRSITLDEPYSICFVCLGNICRSPTAEGVFQHLVNERSLENYFEIDSAGTSSYHVGEPANRHSQKVANENGIELHSTSRQLKSADLEYYDLLLAMDTDNYNNMMDLARRNGVDIEDKTALLRDFDPDPGQGDVPDPYAGGMDGFQIVFDIVKRSCETLLNELEPMVKSSE
jgi:protein-tyrosine phosphatase